MYSRMEGWQDSNYGGSRIMKRLLLILLLCTCAFGQMPYQKPVQGIPINWGTNLSDGIAGMWLFNDNPGVTGTTYDISGNGMNGTLVADTKSVGGRFGCALGFDGTGDYVDLGSQTNTIGGLSQITVAAWVYVNEFGLIAATRAFVDQVGTGYDSIHMFTNATEDMVFEVDDTTHTGVIAKDTDFFITHGADWFCFVGTLDGSFVRLYIDGVEKSSTAWPGGVIDTPSQASNHLVIGDGHLGRIDHVLLYDRALSAGEVAELYSNPFGMFEQPRLPIAAAAGPAGGGQVIMISRLSPYLIVIGIISILAGALGYSSRKAA